MSKPMGIELRGLAICVPGRALPLCRGLDLEVRPGGAAVLTGPSGIGKSSVLKAVMGFGAPDEGQVLIGGKVLNAESVWWMRRQMAYVPQEPRFGDGVVEDVLRRPFAYRAAGGRVFERKEALHVFEELGLDEGLMGSELRDLSAGERQRVAIALVLLLGRPVLVLDEPTSALDAKSREAVSRAIGKRDDLTVLAASHDEHFLALADNVIDLSKTGEAA